MNKEKSNTSHMKKSTKLLTKIPYISITKSIKSINQTKQKNGIINTTANTTYPSPIKSLKTHKTIRYSIPSRNYNMKALKTTLSKPKEKFKNSINTEKYINNSCNNKNIFTSNSPSLSLSESFVQNKDKTLLELKEKKEDLIKQLIEINAKINIFNPSSKKIAKYDTFSYRNNINQSYNNEMKLITVNRNKLNTINSLNNISKGKNRLYKSSNTKIKLINNVSKNKKFIFPEKHLNFTYETKHDNLIYHRTKETNYNCYKKITVNINKNKLINNKPNNNIFNSLSIDNTPKINDLNDNEEDTKKKKKIYNIIIDDNNNNDMHKTNKKRNINNISNITNFTINNIINNTTINNFKILPRKPENNLSFNSINYDNTSNNNETVDKNINRTNKNIIKSPSLLLTQNNQSLNKSININDINFTGNISDYNFLYTLGKGSYAIVKLAVHKPSSLKVAIKIYDKSLLKDIQKKTAITNEIEILKKMNNEYVIKLYEVIIETKNVYLIMELVEGISLLDYIQLQKNNKINEKICKIFYKEILYGIKYCHDNNICHRDIKLENILIRNKDNKIKIIDFGFGAAIKNKKLLQKFFCGTPSYMSPEIIMKKAYNPFMSDIWSLGILLFTMLCGQFPFNGKNEVQLIQRIKRGFYAIPGFVSSKGKGFIRKILKVNPKDRIKINDMLNDSWFDENSNDI